MADAAAVKQQQHHAAAPAAALEGCAAEQQQLQNPPLACKLLVVAASVRTAYLLLIVALAHLIRDYDTSASLLSESCQPDWPQLAARQQRYLPGVVWDSVFLHRIAACGYEYEQFFAFFPGLPGLVRLLRSTGLLQGPWGFSIAALLINNACFLLSVVLLTRLSQRFLKDDRLAATAVLVFIASPASIHHSMLYTEALFTATSWLGLYCLYCSGGTLAASLAFAASAAVRSNGLLNAGFLMHEHSRQFIRAAYHQHWGAALRQAVKGVLCVAIAVAPYAAYMLFGYQHFCTGPQYGHRDRRRPWCSRAVPSAYGYVQDAYWNVGFLRYYELSQVPNFLIAAPTLILSLWGALAYAAANPHHLATGGLLPHKLLQSVFARCGGGGSSAAAERGSAGSSCSNPGRAKWWWGVIVGRKVFCGALDRGADAGAAAKAPSIPGVAYQQLRLRQQEVSAAQQKQPGRGPAAQQEQRQRSPTAPLLRHRQPQPQQPQQPQPGGLLRTRSGGSVGGSGSSKEGSPRRRADSPAASSSGAGAEGGGGCTCASNKAFYSPRAAALVVHWAVLTLVCLAVVHIQVATRFLSSCVPLYWFAALLMLHQGSLLRWLLWWYCFAFMGVGAVMFTNFLPWT